VTLAGVGSQRMHARFVSHRRAFAGRPRLPGDQLGAPPLPSLRAGALPGRASARPVRRRSLRRAPLGQKRSLLNASTKASQAAVPACSAIFVPAVLARSIVMRLSDRTDARLFGPISPLGLCNPAAAAHPGDLGIPNPNCPVRDHKEIIADGVFPICV
jgi:hypothetical protein